MCDPSSDDEKPLDPAAQRIVVKVRWLMLMSGFATFLGIAVVIGVVGYRFFRAEGSAATEIIALLPKGARIVSIMRWPRIASWSRSMSPGQPRSAPSICAR